MATTLDVVNECLESLGEVPLNTLLEQHEFKNSALRALSKANRRVQAPGWWFNLETVTLDPAPLTGQIALAGDTIAWRSGTRSKTGVRAEPKPWLVQRGLRLYDTNAESFVITESVTGELVRLIPFEDLPPVVNDYIAAEAVLRFQSAFDADTQKRADVEKTWAITRIAANAENTRQLGINLLATNGRLQRIKSKVRRYN